MLLIILFISLILATIVISIVDNFDREKWIFIGCIILLFGIIVPLGSSYMQSVELKTTYETISLSYPQAITLYENKAIISEKSITDFKYNSYQNNMSKMIIDLRNRVDEYNRILISKRIRKKNIFFSWLIHDFKELPTIEMQSEFNKSK